MLQNLFTNTDLPNFHTLFAEINTDMGSEVIWGIVVAACFMLTIHGVVVLLIASTFRWIDGKLQNRRIFGASFLSYFIAILLIIASHLGEIVTWTYICIALKVFPTNPETFYFAGEMYTTAGYGLYSLAEKWKILPIIISFTGIFAASMSGAALYSMMGALINHKDK